VWGNFYACSRAVLAALAHCQWRCVLGHSYGARSNNWNSPKGQGPCRTQTVVYQLPYHVWSIESLDRFGKLNPDASLYHHITERDMRRVVVTGLGAVTPLGVGSRPAWDRLLAGKSGIASILNLEPRSRWEGIPSTVAGLVPGRRGGQHEWEPSTWLSSADQARLPRHTQFAIAAGDMAMQDSGWKPTTPFDRGMSGTSIGSGIGDLDQLNNTSLEYQQSVSC